MTVSLVVGAASDIGAACVRRLLERGDTVFGVSRSAASVALESPRYRAVWHDYGGATTVAELFAQEFAAGAINNLVYVAGFHRLQPVTPRSNGALQEHFDLNVAYMVDCVRAFLSPNHSDKSAPRSVTSIASISHRLGESGLIAYSATKAAMVAAARSMAVEFAGRGVRVNTVSPGFLEGKRADAVRRSLDAPAMQAVASLYPLGFGVPDDVAHAVAFLSDPLAARWITGTDLVVDGGRACR